MAKGYKQITGKDGKLFSSIYQPSTEAKLAGKKRKRLLKEIAETIIIPKGDIAEVINKVAANFGINPDEVDIATLADLKQLEKAIVKANTTAYNAVMDRIRGKVLQSIEIEPQQPIKGIRFKDDKK